VTYFRVDPKCVIKCDKGRGSNLDKNSVTYFMDGSMGIRRAGLGANCPLDFGHSLKLNSLVT